jgi:hypothetical protein
MMKIVNEHLNSDLEITDIPIGSIAEVRNSTDRFYLYRINNDQWCWFANPGNTFVFSSKQMPPAHRIVRIFTETVLR